MIERKAERGTRWKIQILYFADEGRRHGSGPIQSGGADSQASHFQNMFKLHGMIRRGSFSVLVGYHT